MAIFSFKCPTHGPFKVMLNKGQKNFKCKECAADSPRILGAGSAFVKEVIDNGLMPRALERYSDIDELMAERIDTRNKIAAGDDII